MTKIILTGSLKERNEETARLINVSEEDVVKAQQVLIDNGIDEDEADSVLQALGYTLLGVELYPNEITGPKPNVVLEFKDNFTISFTYKGKTRVYEILLSEVEKDWELCKWYYNIHPAFSKEHFEVFGSLDDFGIVRTTGPCTCNGHIVPACFGVNAFTEGSEEVTTIDDVDIIAVDTK